MPSSMPWKISLSFLIIGALIGFFFTSQLRADVPVSSVFPADQLVAREQLIKTFVDEQSVLQRRLIDLRQSIEEQQKNNETLVSRTKLSLLEELKLRIGLQELKGAGIVLTLNDSSSAARGVLPEGDQSLIHASDLRDVVNFLWTSQARGIAINEQRILPSSPIAAVGSSILVNNLYLAPPFSVAVVADPDYLRQRLADPLILTDLKKRRRELKLTFEFSVEKQVSAPAFSGNPRTAFLQSLL